VRVGLWLAASLIASGCVTLEHGRGASELAGQSLSTASSPGQERLQIEIEYDSAIRDLISRRGRPEYLHIVNREKLYLFFTEQDSVALVVRIMIPPAEIQFYERTPGFLLNLLPKHEVEAVLAQRDAREQASRRARSAASKKRSVAKKASPPPAAHAPGSAKQISNFDLREIVMRLSAPMTAADPGVSGWRWGRRSDGNASQIADDGTTRYLVAPDSVSVAARIGPSRRSTLETARRGAYRLNRAVFGTRANAVDKHMEPLLVKAVSNSDGPSKQVQRVAGRTVIVSRDHARGFLIYTISAR
jgi:hypothetical protein